ncbi:hypothetical protein V6Z11_A06G117400 [Gossypium hirsutum]
MPAFWLLFQPQDPLYTSISTKQKESQGVYGMAKTVRGRGQRNGGARALGRLMAFAPLVVA